jgi:hypothetical protein
VSALAALVLGGVIGTSAGIVYRNNQELARTNQELARTNQDLEGQRNQARLEEGKANEARDRAEATLVRSLLRPLGHKEGPVNAIELDALWELAESPSDRVQLLFVENAVETAGKARQLRNRAELALHAAVGLDRQRRQQVERILLGRLRDDTVSRALREEVALAAAQANPSSELAAAAAPILTEALARETDFLARYYLARGLSAVAARLGPEEAARLLTEALTKEKEPDARRSLVDGLSAVAARLGPEEAARHAAAAARLLTEALAKETIPGARYWLAQGLSAVAARLGPAEAAAAARLLTEALARETDFLARYHLARGLSAVLARLGPAEAARHAAAAARVLSEALAQETSPGARQSLAEALSAVAARLGPAEAAAAARLLTEALAKEKDPSARQYLAQGLSAVAARLGTEEAVRRSLFAAEAVAGAAPFHPLAGMPALILAAQPLSSRFSTQELVDLLKMPTCVGPARDVILQQLGQRYHREFADVWAFVEYAHEHLPDIDLKTPPKRPGK